MCEILRQTIIRVTAGKPAVPRASAQRTSGVGLKPDGKPPTSARRSDCRPSGFGRRAVLVCAFLGILAQSEKTRISAQELAPRTSEAMTVRVDELLEEHLTQIGWPAANRCDDAAFIRRAYLDLTGSPPTGSEVLDYIRSTTPDKHEQLIDRLLQMPAYATHLSFQWSSWMLPEESSMAFRAGRNGLQNWLRNQFMQNLRYDRLVSDLLVASGSVEAGPTEFFIAHEVKPEKIAATTARVFMGLQLDCAECHDHPFDKWSQEDFWGLAAYFAQLSTGDTQSMGAGGQILDTPSGDVALPGTDEIMQPKPLVATGLSGLGVGTRRQQLTLWLTAPENPFLARAAVNRVWAMLFGRGLIEPIDDMRSIEIASHPQILRELSDYFVGTHYDLKNLIATLAKTQAYCRSSIHLSGIPPEASYAVMPTKPLTERQMGNALATVARQVIGDANGAAQVDLANQLGQLRGPASESKLGIVSALVMLHGKAFDEVSSEDSSRLLKALQAPFMNEQKQFRWLFLSTLNRLPTQNEEAAFSEIFGLEGQVSLRPVTADARTHWQSDLLWALINSTEFAMTP